MTFYKYPWSEFSGRYEIMHRKVTMMGKSDGLEEGAPAKPSLSRISYRCIVTPRTQGSKGNEPHLKGVTICHGIEKMIREKNLLSKQV